MPTLSITKNYADASALTEAHLDAVKSSIETWANTTKLDADNIQASAITSSLIASGAVTRIKQGSVGQQLSSAIATTGTSLSYEAVTNASRTITTSSAGRPVIVFLQPDGSSSLASIGCTSASATNIISADFQILRDGSGIAEITVSERAKEDSNSDLGILVPPGAVWFMDTGVSASTSYTYTIKARAGQANTTWSVSNCKLVAYEL